MRSCCPIPFKYVYIDKYTQFPIVYKGHSPAYFSLDYLQERKRYLVEGIYSNIKFWNKGSRFCYA